MKRPLFCAALVMLISSTAVAQVKEPSARDQQFVFSISTLPVDGPHATVQLDAGFGAHPFEVTDTDRPEHRVGVQAALNSRLTALGRVGLSSDSRDLRTSQQAELLLSVFRSPKSQGSVAAGMGMRHESVGTNVLLARMVAGRSFDAWRLDGNALFEKPFSTGRDAVDLITSIGIARRLRPALYAGIEFVGQDLEGFWEADEAEGGARILLGPSIRLAPTSKNWQLSLAGGPVFRATRAARASEALRGLPSGNNDSQYAVRTLLSVAF